MKKKIILASAFFVMAMAFVLILSADVDAKVKLSSKKKTIYTGQTTTVKLKGTKKKATWTVSNSNIMIVKEKKKSARIKGMWKGTSYLKAKVGKKIYRCKVKVLDKKTTQTTDTTVPTADKVSYDSYVSNDGIIGVFKNNNKCTVSMTAKLVYYKNGVMLDTSSAYNYAFESGKTCALRFSPPYDADYDTVIYDSYDINISVEKGSENLICGVDGIATYDNVGSDKVVVSVQNNSGRKLSTIMVVVVFYNSSNVAIGYRYHYADCSLSGSIDYLTFDFPYDSNYDTITPSSYRIFVNEAYSYSWE